MKTLKSKTIQSFVGIGIALLLFSCGKNKEKTALVDEDHAMVVADEISNHNIKAFAEDAYGHIWIATFRGLNKFDGNKYYQYFCTDDSLGLPDNNVSGVAKDKNNRLWVSTVNGICRYTDRNTFERIPMDDDNRNIVQLLVTPQNRIFIYNIGSLLEYDGQKNRFVKRLSHLDPHKNFMGSIHVDKYENIWVANLNSLRCFDHQTLKMTDSIAFPKGFYPLYTYLQDGKYFWLCAGNGIMLYNTKTKTFEHISSAIASNPVFSHDQVYCIHPYNKGGLLISTAQNGLFYYDSKAKMLTAQGHPGFPFDEPSFKVTHLFKDSRNNLWMGSSDQGYSVNYQYNKCFNANHFLVQAVGHQSVLALAADRGGNLFISTKMRGLMVYNMQNRMLKPLTLAGLDTHDRRSEIGSLLVDSCGKLWLGNGLEVIRMHYDGSRLVIEKRYQVPFVMSLMQGSHRIVWATTASNKIYAFMPDGVLKPCTLYPATFIFMPCALQLRNDRVLTAAFGQELVEVNPLSMEARKWNVNLLDWKRCLPRSSFIPTDLYEDPKGNVYVGTVTNGLMRISPDHQYAKRIDGLSCKDISAIEADRKGNIWVSTMNGLNKIDALTGAITSYYATDGIGGNQFNDRAACLLPNGRMVFGGTHGLTIFSPEKVYARQSVPLVFEILKVHNEVISPETDDCIARNLEDKPKIHLQYDQNSFSISFAALAYGDYERASYSYRLEGFDDYWVESGNSHEAFYANLPAGHYTLKVRAKSKGNDEFTAENEIEVIVASAPWNTWWAWMLYVLAASLVAYQLYRLRQRIFQEHEAVRKAELEKEQECRVNKMNMSFFANISHEFRTPLTMISGPVGMLCDDRNISNDNKKLLLIVQRSVVRMLKLVNQLMDFNKLENDTLKLKVRRTDVVNQLLRICDIFKVNADEKGILLRLYGLEDSYLMWLDTDKLEKIMNNLLSNAMKFTPKGGKIAVSLDVADGNMTVTVADSGRGIPKDQIENIFRRYYQLNNQTKGKLNWGTGIGLYYARKLAELHHGTLVAGNKQDETGAVFTLTLPVGEGIYSDAERALPEDKQTELFPILPQEEQLIDTASLTDGKPTIMVVDDDTEVVNYLQTLLVPYYNVVYRFDAESAYKTISEDEPNLILSDVIMPDKTGYELCREIKENLQLCHIPLILVTAKATVENQVEGLNTGADAYITKPFDPKLLLAMIHSLLANREKVRQLLINSTQTDEIDEKALSPQDKNFMDQLYQIMENELSNPELDVGHLTDMLHISRTKLYYKMKGLTGTNPSVFFKTYKLNRAAELIREGCYTMSEIADRTGFNTPSHFSTSFKKQFGVSPSEYK
ncbi:hybrid sensor histidine kinase/response regulator [Prevotella herbatica]|uniref:histidine kinase n=1 Tax=Prevotella herbatica TaxID=2801997 RepID=A0ABN6EJ29_9BACT|nr:hybrid sensor histidine kinase/response regulator transcription factor [Prevotella herbatica]BCS85308.1 hybrid sensor histidine kinase/response regulator [Prevotella herbatica]